MPANWKPIPGETLIDISGLNVSGVRNRQDLSAVEAENVRKAIVKYMAGPLSRRVAKFDLSWMLKLHREMFGDVWKWAGGSVRPISTSAHHGIKFRHIFRPCAMT